MRSAAAFQLRITPFRVLPIIASSEDSTIEARKYEASAALLLSVISITEPARPMNSPPSVVRGALETSTHRYWSSKRLNRYSTLKLSRAYNDEVYLSSRRCRSSG